MTANILLLDCSNLQSIYDVMIPIWRYETRRPIPASLDSLTSEIINYYKTYRVKPATSYTSVASYLQEQYEFPVITPIVEPHFAAFCKELYKYHKLAFVLSCDYYYICIKHNTMYLELE
jgi:hypothetical protein